MTHNELLARIAKLSTTPETNVVPSELATALMAVVELHTTFMPEFGGGIDYCWADDRPYPCPTIQAIEKEIT